MMLLAQSSTAADETINIMKSFVESFAHLRYDSAIICVVMMLIALYICLEGHGICKAALSLIGFAVGYSLIHPYLEKLGLSANSMFLVQVIVGLICAVVAYKILKIGIFIAVYHFVRQNLSAILVELLAKKFDIPELTYPIVAAIAGVAVALLLAKLATKMERPIVVCITAAIGGFATVDFFMQMIPLFPFDISFFYRVPTMVWMGAKVVLAACGVAVQGPWKAGE